MCSSAGRCRRVPPSTRRSDAARTTSKTTRSNTSTSRASSRAASTAAATSSCGTPGRGSRTSSADPGQAVRSGELHLDMYGAKLRGRFVLVRTSDPGEKEDWLLLHKRDEFAVEGWNPEDHPQSVLSGRTNDEVKADPDRLWRSDLPAARAAIALTADAVDGPTPDELAALDALAEGRHVERLRPRTARHQPGQGPVPGPDEAREAGDEARVPALQRTDRADPAPLPDPARAEPAPLPERRGHERLLAQGGAEPRTGLAAALGQPGRRAKRDADLSGRGRARGTGLGGELRRPRMAPPGRRGSTSPSSPRMRCSTSTRASRRRGPTC